MSILIKGMEMPKDGCHHTICIYADGTVSTGGRVYMATPVPPHGRPIDADALEYEGADVHEDIMCCGYAEDAVWGFSHEMIRNAPTIIPADKEGEP